MQNLKTLHLRNILKIVREKMLNPRLAITQFYGQEKLTEMLDIVLEDMVEFCQEEDLDAYEFALMGVPIMIARALGLELTSEEDEEPEEKINLMHLN